MIPEVQRLELRTRPQGAGWNVIRAAFYAARLAWVGALWAFASVGAVIVAGLHFAELPATIMLPSGTAILDGPLGVIALVSALVGICFTR